MVVGAALRTPPHNLVLAQAAAEDANDLLAGAIRATGVHLPGVVGGLPEAEAFASVWCGRTGEPVRGWLSPGNSESLHTLDLVAAEGIEYVCDWANDELPYPMRTASGTLYSMPYGYEMSDTTLFGQFHYTAPEFAEQVQDQFDLLYREAATQGGRILSLTVHPWLIGQPHRIAALERALAHVVAHAGVWPATGAEILAAFRAQASTPA